MASLVANVCLRRTKAEGGGWMVITAGWAFAVMVAIFCAMAAGAPQADINPALTLIKTVGVYEPLPALITMLCQTAGAFLGACIVWLHFEPHWEETTDSGLILAVFSTGPAIRKKNLESGFEIIGTSMLIIPCFAFFPRGWRRCSGSGPVYSEHFDLVYWP